MNTRLTGRGVHRVARCCTQSASSAFWEASSAVLPSTPAVLRPALISATRRTLSRAFERDRSINFCKLRTFFRSPFRDAVKMRCCKRGTSFSTCCQSIDHQSRTSSSGPFTLTSPVPTAGTTAPVAIWVAVMVSNLPFGSGAGRLRIIHRLTWPRQRPFEPDKVRIRPVIRDPRRREPRFGCPGFPWPFGLPAFASWPSCPAGAFDLPHGRPTEHHVFGAPSGFPRSTRASHDRVGCPLNPGDGGVHPVGGSAVRPAPAASQRPAPAPR
jgi:hypothetical protein